MEFSSRNTQQSPLGRPSSPASVTSNSTGSTTGPVKSGKGDKADKVRNGKFGRVGLFGLLVCVTVVLAATLGILVLGGSDQSKFVNSKTYQAVFLTNGQVYFGHIKDLNNQYIDLTNIYYIQSSDTSSSASSTKSSSNNVTLIKLGCELHAPYDQMIINRSQVSFWENIQNNGQVGQGIAKLKTCTQSSSTTQSTNNAQSSTQTPATTDNSNTNNNASTNSNNTNTTTTNNSTSKTTNP